jgi:hypothetical protein
MRPLATFGLLALLSSPVMGADPASRKAMDQGRAKERKAHVELVRKCAPQYGLHRVVAKITDDKRGNGYLVGAHQKGDSYVLRIREPSGAEYQFDYPVAACPGAKWEQFVYAKK